MTTDDYITQMFCMIMDKVRSQNKTNYYEGQAEKFRSAHAIPRWLYDSLENEYARSLEEPGYTMMTVEQIEEKKRALDNGEDIR